MAVSTAATAQTRLPATKTDAEVNTAIYNVAQELLHLTDVLENEKSQIGPKEYDQLLASIKRTAADIDSIEKNGLSAAALIALIYKASSLDVDMRGLDGMTRSTGNQALFIRLVDADLKLATALLNLTDASYNWAKLKDDECGNY